MATKKKAKKTGSTSARKPAKKAVAKKSKQVKKAPAGKKTARKKPAPKKVARKSPARKSAAKKAGKVKSPGAKSNKAGVAGTPAKSRRKRIRTQETATPDQLVSPSTGQQGQQKIDIDQNNSVIPKEQQPSTGFFQSNQHSRFSSKPKGAPKPSGKKPLWN